MKFLCTKENVAMALRLVAPVANRHANLPILMHVQITASESGVTFVATNLELAVKAFIRAKVEQPGAFTVPAKTLADFVSLVSHDQIQMERVENELVIESGNSRTKMKGAPSDEFPVVPDVTETHGYAVNAEGLKQALGATIIAAAKNDIRPELSGLYAGLFTDRYPGLILAATDSYRLSERKVPVEQGTDPVQVIIPARTAMEMSRMLTDAGGGEKQARLWVGENQIAMRYGDMEMTSRLIDGKYPDYAQIIPASFKTAAIIPSDELQNKIKAASLFATSGVNAISFDMNAADQTIGVSSTSTQTGEHSSSIDGTVEGEENSILLNFRYVLDGLNQMDGDIEFRVNSGDSPCLFRPKMKEDFLYIVMPIRQ